MNKGEPIMVEAYAVQAGYHPEEGPALVLPSAPPEGPNVPAIRNYLRSFSWPEGLVDCLVKNVEKMGMRYFICDDSGSMAGSGGQILGKGNATSRMIACSRWKELTQSLQFHAELAHHGSIPTEFRMLNKGVPIRIGFSHNAPETQLRRFMDRLEESPMGGTPLCRHIRAVVEEVTAQEERLREAGELACVIIATDGEATDGDLVAAMRPLKSLPVWVVVRLCTNQPSVVDYWSEIDKQLELNMEVLDDFQGEAQEIYKHNSWLTYGEPLHRLREFGVHIKEVDLLDEQPCGWEQIRILSHAIYGGKLSDFPHPELDYRAYKDTVDHLNLTVDKVYSPVGSSALRPWVILSSNKARIVPQKGSAACSIS